MLELQARHKNNKKLYRLVALIVLLFLVVILIKPTWNIWRKKVRSDVDFEKTSTRFQELKERENLLVSELERLESQEGQEEEIVRKFDVVREGEQLAIILEPEMMAEPEKAVPGFFGRFFKKYFGWMGF